MGKYSSQKVNESFLLCPCAKAISNQSISEGWWYSRRLASGHLSKTNSNLLEIHKIGWVDTSESKQNYDQIWHM